MPKVIINDTSWRIGCLVVLCLVIIGKVNAHAHSTSPLLLLVSFDGFRWDYLQKYHLENFEWLKTHGSYADFINSSFSTVTFPNHWTLVTGK